ncbi:cytochrome P450 [Ferrimonas pelagia]|uniref:Cytochrome P450 n=1 Tax=Ferrimonas pelagia TaxID=1177826 RepID=A0ABP9FDW9_9GAMM
MDLKFHSKRLAASYGYQAMLGLIAWKMGLDRRDKLILIFAAAAFVCGSAFLIWPQAMANLFEFGPLGDIALTDIRAYYGTMLMLLGAVLAYLAGTPGGAKPAYLIMIVVALGSTLGRLVGMTLGTPLLSIHGGLVLVELLLTWQCVKALCRAPRAEKVPPLPVLDPKTPEEFQPTSQGNFTNPYPYYQMLRDHYPLYHMPDTGYYCMSRYEDIIAATRDQATYSSKLMAWLAGSRSGGLEKVEKLGALGVIPVDVLGIQDEPHHTSERRVGLKGLNVDFVRSLDAEVNELCDRMLSPALARGNMEFIGEFAWKLPMTLIIRLIGFPEADFPKIRVWALHGIRNLSGTAKPIDLVRGGFASAAFMRYLWKHWRLAQKQPRNDFTGMLIKAAADPSSDMTEQRAISILVQLLFAGSDSSASTMGNAVKLLAEKSELQQQLRADPSQIPAFIEEVFRTESAFQGHFRITTRDVTVHDVTIPKDSKVLLMWASGNRDERFWDEPNEFRLNRPNAQAHLTFGHGPHACIGREVARLEIKVVLEQLLARTSRFELVGDAPYEASIFSRSLLSLPIAFAPPAVQTQTQSSTLEEAV